MPEQVAVALRPPKSAAAVPDISEWTPITAIAMKAQPNPTTSGELNRHRAMAMVTSAMNPQISAAGGPRRE